MLILCEKPSVAADFARALGCQKKNGRFVGAGLTITFCVGHLFELCPPEAYNPAFKRWNLSDLPIIPEQFRYEPVQAVKEQTALVLSLLKKHRADDILIATDAGREGELIAREALLTAGLSDLSRCRRFWVSEALTENVIKAGVKNAKPLSEYNALAAQGFARQRADWLAGMNLTRYMSIGNQSLFAVGRVQTALLNAIASRNQEIALFAPKPYQELEALVQSDAGSSVKALLLNPLTGKTAFPCGDPLLSEAKQYCDGKPVDKAEAKTIRKTRKPEKLLNVTGLQKESYKRFGYSPEKTLETAQSLYEKRKCLSYPRTPSRVMGDNNAELFKQKFDLLKGAFPHLSRFCDPALIAASNKHIFNSADLEDHHALIPLNPLPSDADEAEKNVFGIVVESFFTACTPDYIYDEKQLTFHCGRHAFAAAIRQTVQQGWKAAAAKDEDDSSGAQEVSAFDERHCRVAKTEALSKKTAPPKEFSIDALLSFMENPRGEDGARLAGLGTPATRADIIKKLFSREYVFEKGKKLYASDKGLFLLKQLQKDPDLAKIADVGQTTEWERELFEDPAAFEKRIVSYIRSCVKKDARRDVYEKAPLGKCPVCGRGVLEAKKNFYCPGYKDAEKPCSFTIWKETCGARISVSDAQALLAGKRTAVKKCASKAGKSFSAKFYLDKDSKVAFDFVDKIDMANRTARNAATGRRCV
jgi:DNA topoisomerase-3